MLWTIAIILLVLWAPGLVTSYTMADSRIPKKTQEELLADFEKVEEERVGHVKHEEFHRLLDHLREIYLT